jgi:xylulokinase
LELQASGKQWWKMSLLGIDVGTSGCKAALFSENGELLSLAYEEYDYQHPQLGWAELDTPRVWEQIKQTIRKAATGADRDPVRALCVSSLGEAVVPVTADRKILGPSLLNFDSRGEEYLASLHDMLPDEWLYRINGNTPGNHYSLTKLMWLKQHQPELYQKTDFFLHWSGFVAFMLGAEARVDYSLANRTLLFDLERADWSGEILERVKLGREKLPPTVPAGTVIGAVDRAIGLELGIPAGIPIISGGHDQCCNAIGCGVIAPGQAAYGMGTYLCMTPVFDRRPEAAAMIARGLNTEHHAVPGQYVSFIYNQGGALVKWFRDTFAAVERQQAKAKQQDIYDILLAEMPDSPSRVIALPHFTSTGPPQFISDSCGVIAGVKLETTRGEILKGLIEATTYYLRESFETLPEAGINISDFRAVGGGSKSDAWVQICADIMGRPFVRPKINEAGVLGAAILAGTGCGLFSSLQEGVKNMVQLNKTFIPDPSKHSKYNERFNLYQRLWPQMADYLRALA